MESEAGLSHGNRFGVGNCKKGKVVGVSVKAKDASNGVLLGLLEGAQ
jgi:hypothetical protein